MEIEKELNFLKTKEYFITLKECYKYLSRQRPLNSRDDICIYYKHFSLSKYTKYILSKYILLQCISNAIDTTATAALNLLLAFFAFYLSKLDTKLIGDKLSNNSPDSATSGGSNFNVIYLKLQYYI